VAAAVGRTVPELADRLRVRHFGPFRFSKPTGRVKVDNPRKTWFICVLREGIPDHPEDVTGWVSSERWKGLRDGLEVKHDARPGAGSARRLGEDRMEMRLYICHEQRMLRSLHGRWPYRRSHCRHDLHWLVRVQACTCSCASGRAHSLTALRACTRRPEAG
jgi:hypothetical protein